MPNVDEIADLLSEDILSRLPDEVINELANLSGDEDAVGAKVREILANYNIDIDQIAQAKVEELNHE